MFDERGQAYTLEGLVAAVLIASSVILGLQAVDVAPWTSGPDDDTLDSLRTQGEDVLAAAAEDGTLDRAVTCHDGDVPETDAYVPSADSATSLGPMLNETFGTRGYSYNVFVVYEDGGSTNETLVYPETEQQPDSDVVTVSRRLALFDNSTVHEPSAGTCQSTDQTLAEREAAGDAYLPDQHPNSELYAIVEVRVEVW